MSLGFQFPLEIENGKAEFTCIDIMSCTGQAGLVVADGRRHKRPQVAVDRLLFKQGRHEDWVNGCDVWFPFLFPCDHDSIPTHCGGDFTYPGDGGGNDFGFRPYYPRTLCALEEINRGCSSYLLSEGQLNLVILLIYIGEGIDAV